MGPELTNDIAVPGRRVLLVEDDPVDAKLIRSRLPGPDDVVHVSTLGDALRELSATVVDAILLDLRLPDGDGVDNVVSLRSFDARLPIVVLTGLDDHDMAMQCIGAGAQDYLRKDDLGRRDLVRALDYATLRVQVERERGARVAAEQTVLERGALIEALLDQAPDQVVYVDTSGVVRFSSRVALGHERSALLGTLLKDAMPPDEGRGIEERLQSVLDTGATLAWEHERHSPLGVRELRSLRMGPIRRHDEVVGAAIISRDVSDQRAHDARLAASDRMASVGLLAAGVAHEINNPLASLVANLDLALLDLDLARQADTPRDAVAESVREAQAAASRVCTIVRDLRTMSRPSGRETEPIDVRTVLDSTLRLCRHELRNRARVIKRYADVPPVVGGAGRLGQVFLNLVVNAAHAIEEGAPTRNTLTISTEVAGPHVVVSVADSGAGVPPALRSRIFDAFFTTKPTQQGTGLGLAITRRIIESLGGGIELDSEVGVGTEFRVKLPAAAAVIAAPVQQRADTVPNGRGRLLVIEDDPAVALVIRRTLERRYEVTVAADGARALAAMRREGPYDVILCDLVLPGINGEELYREVVLRWPQQADRFAFMTGGATTPGLRRFLDTVSAPYIRKPFNVGELEALVQARLQTVDGTGQGPAGPGR